MTVSNFSQVKHHIRPYHMNGLNWRLSPDKLDRDNMVIVAGFMPAWWTKEYGITFGSDFHLNAEVHRNTLAEMEAILRERFADLPNFFCGDDYANSYPVERRYGDAFIPALFGSEVVFDDASGHPFAKCLLLSDEDARNLEVPDVVNNPIFKSLLKQRQNENVRVTGELGFEGVINIAHKLRGEEMFVDMIQEPDLIHHVFEVVYQTIDSVVHLIREWQNPDHIKPNCFVHCNCLINMISAEMYRQQLLEFDQRFSKSFDVFGMHTCNWTVDPYLDAIAEIENLDYLDMGADSDLDRVHRLFPDLCPSVFVHPQKFRSMSPSEINNEITELGKRIGKGYILLSDLEAGTTDDQIRAAYEAASQFS